MGVSPMFLFSDCKFSIIGAITVGFLFTRRQWDDPGTPPAEADGSPRAVVVQLTFSQVIRRPAVWMYAALFFFYTGLELSFGVWTASLLGEARGADVARTGTAVALYWSSVTAGRFVIGSFANRVSSDVILRPVTLVAPVLILVFIWFGKSCAMNVAGLMVIGFLVSPIFPLWTSLTPRRVGAESTTHAIGMQIAAAAVGMSVLPALMGVAAKRWGLEAIPPAMFALSIVVLALHEWAIRMERRGVGRAA